jgi:alpha-beta hydrolase superfamily lysophospholipase
VRRLVRLFAATALVLLAAGILLGILFRSTVSAHARALTVLARTLEVPVASWFVGWITDEPRYEESPLAGVPATLVRPGGGGGPWPAIVFVNGATERGRRHPDVRRLAAGLARAGYVVAIPDPRGLAQGEITLRTLRDCIAATRAVADRDDVAGREIGLAGVSVGTTLALLVAEDPKLARRVTLVAGIAPFADLREVIRLATTGRHRVDGRFVRHDADPFVGLVVARSLVGGMPARSEREPLRRHLSKLDDDTDAPLAGLPEQEPGTVGKAVVALLENDDPKRFDELYAALPAAMRHAVASLSPLARIASVQARVELASAPEDKYFPLADSRALVAGAREGRLTVTETLDHAVPAASLHELADLFRFYGFLVRSLRHARER